MLIFNRKPFLSTVAIGTVMASLVISALVFAPMRLSAAEFFRSVDDLPLAPGLTEIVDEGVEFDSPAGRIVTAVASGGSNGDAVRAFYRKALPPLGWLSASDTTYRRDGELLTLQLETIGKVVKLKIRVVPAPSEGTR